MMKTPEEIMMDEGLMDKHLNGDHNMCWNYCGAVCDKLGKTNKYHEVIDETGWHVYYVIYGWDIAWNKKVSNGLVTLNIENNQAEYVNNLRLKDKRGKIRYTVYIEGADKKKIWEHKGKSLKKYDSLEEAKEGVWKFFAKEMGKIIKEHSAIRMCEKIGG